MRTRLFVAAAALSLLSISGLIAQNRGTIAPGTVVDDRGTPLPGVAVELTGPDTRKTVSDARGRFSFGLLAPGAYQILASGWPASTTSCRPPPSRRVRQRG